MYCTTVIVVDDHPVVRMGVEETLKDDDGISLLFVAATGEEAVAQTQSLLPDVLITDLVMPGMSGFDVMRQIRELRPSTRMIAFSSQENRESVLEALGCGASGYVSKNADPSELLEAVREVAAGRRFLSPAVAANMTEDCVENSPCRRSDPLSALTAREREVFLLAAGGRSNAQLGEAMFISPRTAETHRSRMMRKLNLKSSVDLALFAVRHGFIVH